MNNIFTFCPAAALNHALKCFYYKDTILSNPRDNRLTCQCFEPISDFKNTKNTNSWLIRCTKRYNAMTLDNGLG